MKKTVHPGNLIIIAAPSGAGKTTIVRELVKQNPSILVSISHTTRPPRPSDIDGQDYHFISPDTFRGMLDKNLFLESANVYGNWYGTSKAWVTECLIAGKHVMLEIDWQGANHIRTLFPNCISIFILPPSINSLKKRLINRAQDNSNVIETRMNAARNDIAHASEFKYVLVNHAVNETVNSINQIIQAESQETPLSLPTHKNLIAKLLETR